MRRYRWGFDRCLFLASLTCVIFVPAYAQREHTLRPRRDRDTRSTVEAAGQGGSSARIDTNADTLVREMCAYLARQPVFRVLAEHSTEVILDNGQKLDYGGTSTVTLMRPNYLRSDRQGDVVDVSLYYDGASIVLYGRRSAMYAKIDAPTTLEKAIDFAREELGLEAPAADLLSNDSCAILMSDIVSGQVIGEAVIDGVLTHHVALRGREVDLQLWIEAGPRPLPHRYIITSKHIEGMPQHTLDLREWDLSPLLTEDMFRFVAPPGVDKVGFFRAAAVKTSVR
ncbi:MAG: DUF2092 domain-containing protein [Myxococcota bacterium]